MEFSASLFFSGMNQPQNGRKSMNSEKPRILIVDDEPAIADTIQYALEMEGFLTLTSHLGAPVAGMIGENPVDLVILDIGLPDISGTEVLRRIREQSRVPVIFLTARSGEIDKVLGLELGGDDYVVKPFSPRELAARVKAVLRRSREGAVPEERDTAIWRVDEARRGIFYHGIRLDLSRYEYNILQVFLRRRGHVFTRDQLMDAAWDEPEASMDRTVDAHIKNIRAKLKIIRPDDDPILTHRGIGYSLKEDA